MIEKISAIGSRVRQSFTSHQVRAKITRSAACLKDSFVGGAQKISSRIAPVTAQKAQSGKPLNKYEKASYAGMGMTFFGLGATLATASPIFLALAGTGIAITLVSEFANIINGR